MRNSFFSLPFTGNNIGTKRSILSQLREKAEKNKNIIDFGVSTPQNENLPFHTINKVLQIVSKMQTHEFYKYASPKGLNFLRKMIAYQYKNFGISEDNVLIIDGAQHGFFIIAKTILDRNDIVLCEKYTYPGFFHNSFLQQAKIEIINQNPEEGLDFNDLERKLKKLIEKNKFPKIFWVQPYCHNPYGYTLSLSQKERLIDLAHHYKFFLVEDCVYWFFEKELPPLLEIEKKKYQDKAGWVIHIHSFSKSLGPGLRKGFIATFNKKLLELMINCRQITSRHSPPLIDFIMGKLLEKNNELEFDYEEWIEELRKRYEKKRKIAEKALKKFDKFLELEIVPKAGLFLFPKIKKFLNYEIFVKKCAHSGILIAPDYTFMPNPKIISDFRYFRISITAVPLSLIKEGIEKIGKIIEFL